MNNKNNKQDTIQKLDVYHAIHEKIPFSILPHKVLQNLRDPIALSVWCYLQSLPPDWTVIKSHVREHFDIGEKKCKSVFALLNDLKLIEYARIRNEDGTLGSVAVVIKSGEQFAFEETTTGSKTSPVEVTTGAILHPVVNHTCGKEGTTYTIYNTYTTELTNVADSQSAKKKSSYEKDARFMRFYSAYPRKAKPQDAWKAFKAVVGDDDVLLERIMQDIEKRSQEHDKWQDKQFIPYPATYLRSGDYESEIFNAKNQEAVKKMEAKRNAEAAHAIRLKAQEELAKTRELSKPNQETGKPPRKLSELLKEKYEQTPVR